VGQHPRFVPPLSPMMTNRSKENENGYKDQE
jgi:hypothetical protein